MTLAIIVAAPLSHTSRTMHARNHTRSKHPTAAASNHAQPITVTHTYTLPGGHLRLADVRREDDCASHTSNELERGGRNQTGGIRPPAGAPEVKGRIALKTFDTTSGPARAVRGRHGDQNEGRGATASRAGLAALAACGVGASMLIDSQESSHASPDEGVTAPDMLV